MHVRIARLTAILIVIILCGCGTGKPKKLDVLFLGDSFIYNNDLPGTLKNLAKSLGKNIEIGESTAPNYRIVDHLKSEQSLSIIESKQWDYVIINENNLVLINPDRYENELYPGIKNLSKLLKKQNLPMHVIINWAFKQGAFFPGIETYDKMQNEIINIIEALSREHSFSVIPVGQAWQKAHSSAPAVELWASDSKHPGPNGTYLTACVIYSYIFKETSEGASYIATLVTRENALILQQTAFDIASTYLQ